VTDLRDLANGYRVSQAIHVAATLGIADLLADGPLAKAGLRLERSRVYPDKRVLERSLAVYQELLELGGE
jgi:hypothetical protein